MELPRQHAPDMPALRPRPARGHSSPLEEGRAQHRWARNSGHPPSRAGGGWAGGGGAGGDPRGRRSLRLPPGLARSHGHGSCSLELGDLLRARVCRVAPNR